MAQGSSRLRLGIVGLGMAVKPHALAIKDLADRIEFAGAYSPTPARREAFTRDYDLPAVPALDALLGDPGLDAILLLTPPTTHLDLARQCLEAGKHLLLEKPIEVTLARATALVEAAEWYERTLAVVFQHRFRPAARRLRGILAEGRLGPLVSASASIRWWRAPGYFAEPGRGMKARDGGGVLLTQAIHSLDLFGTLTGPPAEVAAFATTSPRRRIDTEDVVAASLRFPGGAIGVIDATTTAYPGFSERIDLAGTQGTAVLEGDRLTLRLQDGTDEDLGAGGSTGGGADPMAFDHGPHRALIADFADAVLTGRSPDTNGRSALEVHRLIDALLRSAEERRFIPLSQS
jgi:predicted dehydrogenase